MLKHIWESFAGFVAEMWGKRDDDLLGTCVDRMMAMLVVAMVSLVVFIIGVLLFALAGRPMILLGSAAIVAGIYLLTRAVAKAGEKHDGDARHDQEKA